MAKESSFDIVSEPQWSEVFNAIDQTRREANTRFDFRGQNIEVEYDQTHRVIILNAPWGMVMDSLKTVLGEKMARRTVSLRFLEFGADEAQGMNRARCTVTLKTGIQADVAKKIQKAIRGLNLKVEPQIQGDTVRVSGKNRDDLQQAILFLKGQDFGIELLFNNFRTS